MIHLSVETRSPLVLGSVEGWARHRRSRVLVSKRGGESSGGEVAVAAFLEVGNNLTLIVVVLGLVFCFLKLFVTFPVHFVFSARQQCKHHAFPLVPSHLLFRCHMLEHRFQCAFQPTAISTPAQCLACHVSRMPVVEAYYVLRREHGLPSRGLQSLRLLARPCRPFLLAGWRLSARQL
jgi:hypothetical protein